MNYFIDSVIIFFIIIFAIGLAAWIFNKLSSNAMAQTLFEKETLKALKTNEGTNIIREQAQIANAKTFERAFDDIKTLSKNQEKTDEDLKCTNKDLSKINETLISFIATITADIKYLVKTVDEIKNKKTSK